LDQLASNAKLMQYQVIALILGLLHQKIVGAIGSKICSVLGLLEWSCGGMTPIGAGLI
jgi:hypothetical protein